MNQNSRTHEKPEKSDSRQDAKGETIFNIQQEIFNFQRRTTDGREWFPEGLPVRRGGTSVLPGIGSEKSERKLRIPRIIQMGNQSGSQRNSLGRSRNSLGSEMLNIAPPRPFHLACLAGFARDAFPSPFPPLLFLDFLSSRLISRDDRVFRE